jgi:hypothetical protein
VGGINKYTRQTARGCDRDNIFVRYQVLAAETVKVTVFGEKAPCSLIEVHRRFRGT